MPMACKRTDNPFYIYMPMTSTSHAGIRAKKKNEARNSVYKKHDTTTDLFLTIKKSYEEKKRVRKA